MYGIIFVVEIEQKQAILHTVAITNSTGEVEDSDVIVAGIAFILSRARHICMLCDNWPVIWTGVSQ